MTVSGDISFLTVLFTSISRSRAQVRSHIDRQPHVQQAEVLHPRRPLLCDILFCSGDLHCVPDIVLGDVPGLHQIGRHSEDAGQAPKQVAVVPVPKAADALPPSAGYRRRIASEQYGSTSIQHKALASGSQSWTGQPTFCRSSTTMWYSIGRLNRNHSGTWRAPGR